MQIDGRVSLCTMRVYTKHENVAARGMSDGQLTSSLVDAANVDQLANAECQHQNPRGHPLYRLVCHEVFPTGIQRALNGTS